MSSLLCFIETLAAEVDDIGEDIEQINMEFTNHENYDSDDSFLASESEPTVYGDSDSDSDKDKDEKKTDKKNKVQYLVPPSQRRRRIIVDSDSEDEEKPKPRR